MDIAVMHPAADFNNPPPPPTHTHRPCSGKNVHAPGGFGQAPQITDLEAFGLSGDWEGEAGDRGACLEKHQGQEIQISLV